MIAILTVASAALIGLRVWLRRPLTPTDARCSAVDVSIDLRREASRAVAILERTAS